MQDQLYRDIILDHWKNPQNYGVLQDPDIDLEENNPYCGDRIRLTIKWENGIVKDIAFIGEGCAISKASASLFTQDIKDKSVSYLNKLNANHALDLLGITLTPTRTKCALLIYATLKKGLRSL